MTVSPGDDGPSVVSLPGAVLALIDAADAETLLHDADSLAEGLSAAGWTPRVESGRFGAEEWDLWSSAFAPSLSVFRKGDELEVRRLALAVASAVSSRGGHRSFHPLGTDWSSWPEDDGQWEGWDGLGTAQWLEWHGRGARVSLTFAPDRQIGTVHDPAHLTLSIGRDDEPTDGLPRDDERARRVVREGSVVARWYLAGEHELPEDVISALEADPDLRVRAAAEWGTWLRARTTIGPPPQL